MNCVSGERLAVSRLFPRLPLTAHVVILIPLVKYDGRGGRKVLEESPSSIGWTAR